MCKLCYLADGDSREAIILMMIYSIESNLNCVPPVRTEKKNLLCISFQFLQIFCIFFGSVLISEMFSIFRPGGAPQSKDEAVHRNRKQFQEKAAAFTLENLQLEKALE